MEQAEDISHTISIGEDRTAYDVPLDLLETSIFIYHLMIGSGRELNAIYDSIGLDYSVRREPLNLHLFITNDEKIEV